MGDAAYKEILGKLGHRASHQAASRRSRTAIWRILGQKTISVEIWMRDGTALTFKMALQDVKLCVSGRRQRFSSDRMWALDCKAWIYRKTCNPRLFSYPNPSTKLATSFSLASSCLEDWTCKNCQRRQNHAVWTKWEQLGWQAGMYAINCKSIRMLVLFMSPATGLTFSL